MPVIVFRRISDGQVLFEFPVYGDKEVIPTVSIFSNIRCSAIESPWFAEFQKAKSNTEYVSEIIEFSA